MDILTLLDELRTIARNGLAYAENPYDRERYERLLALTVGAYAEVLALPSETVRARLTAELGYTTPKVGANAAIFDAAGRILLVQRSDDQSWCLPCGWVDPGETPLECAVREAREETGLEARAVRLVDVFALPAGLGHHVHGLVALVYLCEPTGGELDVSHECLDASYWPVEEVPVWHPQHRLYAEAARRAWSET